MLVYHCQHPATLNADRFKEPNPLEIPRDIREAIQGKFLLSNDYEIVLILGRGREHQSKDAKGTDQPKIVALFKHRQAGVVVHSQREEVHHYDKFQTLVRDDFFTHPSYINSSLMVPIMDHTPRDYKKSQKRRCENSRGREFTDVHQALIKQLIPLDEYFILFILFRFQISKPSSALFWSNFR